MNEPFSGEIGDVIVDLPLSREKLATGGKFPVSFTRYVPCDTCKGAGRKAGTPACGDCEGKGRVEKKLEDAPSAFLIDCPKCSGRGHAEADACPDCTRGYTKTSATMDIEVPALSSPGAQLRIPDQGHVRPDKPRGNVIVVLLANDPTATLGTTTKSKPGTMMLFLVVCVVVLVVALMLAR